MSHTLVLPLAEHPSFYLVGRVLLKECLLSWYEPGESLNPHDQKLVDNFPQSSIPRGGEVFIGLVDGEPVGFAAIAKTGEGIFVVKHLYVVPEHYYEGVEKDLLEHSIKWVNREKRSLEVLVEPDNLDAVRMYQGLGFEVVEAGESLSRMLYRVRSV